jgi:septal ring factor EnvC (AmiA/AmiB activator)
MRTAKLLILVLCVISCQQDDKSNVEMYESEISKLNTVLVEKEEELSALNQSLIQKEGVIADLVDSLRNQKNGDTANQQVGLNLNAFEQLLENQIHLNEDNSNLQYILTSYEFLTPNLVIAEYSDGHNYLKKKVSLKLVDNTIEVLNGITL